MGRSGEDPTWTLMVKNRAEKYLKALAQRGEHDVIATMKSRLCRFPKGHHTLPGANKHLKTRDLRCNYEYRDLPRQERMRYAVDEENHVVTLLHGGSHGDVLGS